MNALTEAQRAYLAGMVDGDGCIFIVKSKGNARKVTPSYDMGVIISQSNYPYLEYLRNLIGSGAIRKRTERTRGENIEVKYRYNCADNFNYILRAGTAAWFIDQIIDFLIIKKEQARVALEFYATVNHKALGRLVIPPETVAFREKCYQTMKALNQKRPESPEIVIPHKVNPQMFLW